MHMGVLVLALFLFLGIGALLYFVSVYNGLIRLSRNIDKAWSNIDVLLKQRHDEIPKLVKVCQGYMQYEKETLEKITQARTACMQAKTVGESSKAEGQLAMALKTLFAVAENYPDLKANQNFGQLQQRVSYLENQIADRREFYNDSVNNYNIRIHQIPDLFVANMLSMKARELFKVSEEDRKDVDINF
ncbi:MAG: LemA family protein [Candidatus Omnitrophica bacterium]|nr:LemA family protein [Candidatus Omnitrophota bacterium]